MLGYIVKRVLRMIPLLFLLSILAFTIIHLPPGDYVTEYIANLGQSGASVDESEIARLRQTYGLDRPVHEQYLLWMSNILLRGDFGLSFQWNKPVAEVITERMLLTFLIALCTTAFVWIVAIPIGIYVSVHQYTLSDYVFTLLGFIGLAIPSFLLALLVMYLAYSQLGVKVSGLYAPEYELAPWSFEKIQSMVGRIWVPILILGVGGMAQLIRTMRATMLDELRKPYVTVARAKGLSEFALLIRYPVRIAINPLISTIGRLLPWFVSGGTIVEIVLNLPTAGPVLWNALKLQDMYLAGSYILLIGAMTMIGSLLSDILLAWLDPRIRLGQAEAQ